MKKRLLVLIFIIFLLAFHAFNNYYILTKSRYIPAYDSMRNFQELNRICQSLALKSVKSESRLPYRIYNDLMAFSLHPKLFFYTAAPFFLLRIDKNVVVMANFIYFAILLFATYGFAKRLYNSEVGILAAFILSMFPTVFSFSRVFMLDFPVMALVALTFYLFTLNRFDNFVFVFLAGITFASGSLLKESYFIYLIPLFLYFIQQQRKKREIKSIIGFICSVLFGLLIVGRYYFQPEKTALFYGWMFERSNFETHFYFKSLCRQLLPIFFLLFCASFVFFYRKKQYFLPSMTIGLLLFFSLSPNAHGRFILPLFPYIAVMIAVFIWSLPKFRKISVSLLVVFSFAQYFATSYSAYIEYRAPQIIPPIISGLDQGLTTIIDEGPWQGPAERLIEIMMRNKKMVAPGSTINLGLFSQERIYYALTYYAIVKKFPLEIHIPLVVGVKPYMVELEKKKNEFFDDPAANFDFIIVENSLLHSERMLVQSRDRLNHFKQNFMHAFILLDRITIPDGGFCEIYKKRG